MTHHGIAQLILAWAKSTFGEVASDPVERAARCLEEAAEVAQAGGVPLEMAQAIIAHTYSRPADTVQKEIGGLLVTVYALSAVHGLDPQDCLETEVARVLAKDPAMWRRKHNDKVLAGTSTARADVLTTCSNCGRAQEEHRTQCIACGFVFAARVEEWPCKGCDQQVNCTRDPANCYMLGYTKRIPVNLIPQRISVGVVAETREQVNEWATANNRDPATTYHIKIGRDIEDKVFEMVVLAKGARHDPHFENLYRLADAKTVARES